MLVRIFTIIALLIFVALVFMGSSIEMAMLKSAAVFVVLVVGTRICLYLLDIIKESSPNEQESPSHN
ncbi:MAG: hypothetical protein PVI44_04105 [Balneolaceae bacterium]|jgi:hypothetical protein